MQSKTMWAAGIVVLVLVGVGQAATPYNWNVTNGGNWSVTGNWSPGGGPPVAGDTATFTGTVNQTVGITVGNQAVDYVYVNDSAAWTWNQANSLTVGKAFTYNSSNTGSVFSAILAGVMNNGGLIINAGRLTLSNTGNTFNGGININGGSLAAGSTAPGTLGASIQTINIGPSAGGNIDAKLMLAAVSPTIYTNPIVIQPNSGGSGRAMVELYSGAAGSPGAKLVGGITLNKDLHLLSAIPPQSPGNRTIVVTNAAGPGVTGTGNLIKDGMGRVDLTASNNYVGQTIVTGGRLMLITTTNGSFKGTNLAQGGMLLAQSDGALGDAANTIALGSPGRFGGFGCYGAAYPQPPFTTTRPITLSGNGGFLAGQYPTFILGGKIDGSGMLLGNANVDIIVTLNATNTYTGGTRFPAGRWVAGNADNVFGTGDLTIEQEGYVTFLSETNIAAGRKVLLTDLSPGMNGAVYAPLLIIPATVPTFPTIDPNSAGGLALNGSSSAAVNGALSNGVGNGYMFLGGGASGGTLTGTYLAIGAGNTYRLGCAAGTLTLNGSVLTDKSAVPANVVVGRITDIRSTSASWGLNCAVTLASSNTYSGTTTVYRGSTLAGNAQTTVGQSPFGSSNGPVNLVWGTLKLIAVNNGLPAAKGLVYLEGNAYVQLDGTVGAYTAQVAVASLNRVNNGILFVQPRQNLLGSRERLVVTGGVASVNGMVAPYLLNNTNWANNTIADFIDYGANGFTGVVYRVNGVAASVNSQADFDNTRTTDIVNATVDLDISPSGKTNVGLKTVGALTNTGTLFLSSGGLILTGANRTNTANLASTGEVVVCATAANLWNGTIIASNGLTKTGPGKLTLGADNSALLYGDITVNDGTLTVTNDNQLGAPGNRIVLNRAMTSKIGLIIPNGGIAPARSIWLGANGGTVGSFSGGTTGVILTNRISGPGDLVLFSSDLRLSNTNVAAPNDYAGGTHCQNALYVSANSQPGTGPLYNTYIVTVEGDSCLASNRTINEGFLEFTTTAPVAASLEGGRRGDGNRGGYSESDVYLSSTTPAVLTIGGNNLSTEYYGQIREYNDDAAYAPAGSGIKKVGIGTLGLWGDNLYSGPTVVTQGTLMVNGWINTNGVVKVYPGATLDGIGTVGIVSNLGGTVRGNLHMRQLVMNSASLLNVTLSGTNVVSQYGQLHVTESMTLAGTLSINFSSGFTPSVGQTFTILSNTGAPITTQFASGRVATGVAANGKTYYFGINYAGGAGNDIVLTALPSGTVMLIR